MPPEPEPNRNRKMVVICDDNAALALLMKHLLSKKGFSVRTAGDGNEGLDIIRAVAPDLLLLDLAMPGLDGLGVLKKLPVVDGKKPYTIVITGQESVDMREQAATLGSDEVWRKPFNAGVLISRIEALIAQGTI